MGNTVANGLWFFIWNVQSLCVRESENTKDNARFAIAFGLCHNLCAHMWKTQLKIQFAIPFEKKSWLFFHTQGHSYAFFHLPPTCATRSHTSEATLSQSPWGTT